MRTSASASATSVRRAEPSFPSSRRFWSEGEATTASTRSSATVGAPGFQGVAPGAPSVTLRTVTKPDEASAKPATAADTTCLRAE
jgi:hypothetical protein